MTEEKNSKYERLYTILLWGIVAWFTILYVTLIFSRNIWTDEAFTIQLLGGAVFKAS